MVKWPSQARSRRGHQAQPTMLFLCLPLLALAADVGPLSFSAGGGGRSYSNNSIASFGWYWAMENGGGNATALNQRNCSAPGPCSWEHANVDFVQNCWKNPSRWQPDGAADWDASDVLELASKGVRSVVSVTHLFAAGPTGPLLTDYETRWTKYLAQMKAAGALPHVAYWYPADEPDLPVHGLPAASLNKILAAIKAQSPEISILLTLSNLALNQTTGDLNYALDTTRLQPTDVLTFDIYSSGNCYWGAMKAKLDVLSAFVSAHKISMAVIPDATADTFAALGAAGNNVLNDQFYLYCAARSDCVGLFPFIGGTWHNIVIEPAVLASFDAIADAVKTGDWSQTAVDPAVVCDKGDLYHMPCLGAAAGAAAGDAAGDAAAAEESKPQQCNKIARGGFGFETNNRSAIQSVLPDRACSMIVGQVWEYQHVCREIIGAPGTLECSGGSVACWKGVLGWKSKVVSCNGADVRHYTDECTAHTPAGKIDHDWTCCVRQKAPFKSDDEPAHPITWVSAGDAAGQALLVGMPLVPPTTSSAAAAATTLSAQLVHGSQKLQLAVLQQGNGSMMLGLPKNFKLGPWGLQLCTGGTGSRCTDPVVPIYAPDVMWTDCDGAACAAGGTLRVFGRRLAFDASGCRPYNSTLSTAGRELQLQLTPISKGETAAAPVVLKATQQSCFDAAFALPTVLAPGTYTVSVANSVVAGHLSDWALPTQPDVQVLRVAGVAQRGTVKINVPVKTGAAIVTALAEAAKTSTGAIVQLTAGTYHLEASDTLVVGNGVTLRGDGRLMTTLIWGRQTLATAIARRHLALIHGDNTTGGWTLQDLSIVAPQADHLNQYWGSAVVTDCSGEGTFSDGSWQGLVEADGLYTDKSYCSGMVIERVKITIDKVCKPGSAWPAETDYSRSCGGYTAINSSYSHSMFAGVVSAVRILGENAVFQDSEIVHYGTCGSNVAFALEVNSARNIVVRRNTLRYGCTAYGIAATDGIVFEHNTLIPYKNASGGGSNVQVFGARQQMRRMLFANNTQLLCEMLHPAFCPPGHLETMTTDGGAGFYEGKAGVATDLVTLKTAAQGSANGQYNADATGKHRHNWRFAAVCDTLPAPPLTSTGSATGT